MFREFKPSLLFLARFLGIYLAGNILYGIFIESYGDDPDAITQVVSRHAVTMLTALGYSSDAIPNTQGPTVFIESNDRRMLNVYEGCNGVNVMILFVAFIVAFGGQTKKMLWFIPAGLLVVHLCNLARIALLYFVVEYYNEYFYFVHKYFFTAILYLVIFAMWVIWVVKFNPPVRKNPSADESAG